MGNITIGRYGETEAKDLESGKGFSAWIEGTGDNGESWILWLDEKGNPIKFYGQREPSG